MTILEFLLLLVIAGICGGIAQTLSGYTHRGCLATIALGFIGALLGTYLQRVTGLPEILTIPVGERAFPIIWSVIGGVLFSAAVGFITRRPRNM